MLENQMVLGYPEDDLPSVEIPSGHEIYSCLPNKLANELASNNVDDRYGDTGKKYLEAILDAHGSGRDQDCKDAIAALKESAGNEDIAVKHWLRVGK